MEIPAGVWSHYGYESTPYSTTALRIKDADERLLVGRDEVLKLILRDLASGSQMIALEGDYGVGKSSLAAVATSQAARWKTRRVSGPRFLASGSPLELIETDTAESLEKRAYYQIAGAILAESHRLVGDGLKLNQIKQFERWLMSSDAGSWSAGIGLSFPGLIGANGSLSGSSSPNSSAGFSDHGIVTMIDSWLAEIYPSPEHGGVILLLDNLEVLARFSNATRLFESLRDRLFKRPGLRWIISGAEGMVRTALSTPKMSGVFSDPIELLPIESTTVADVVTRRAEVLKQRSDAKLPVSPEAFEAGYLATGQNLRFALGLADRFSMRTDPAQLIWADQAQRDRRYLQYRVGEGTKIIDSLSSDMTAAGWRIVTVLVRDKNGVGSPSEFADFGYRDANSLLRQIEPLARIGLLTIAVDDDDSSRRVITATEKARLAVSSRADSGPFGQPAPTTRAS
jgi:hypothetical protein